MSNKTNNTNATASNNRTKWAIDCFSNDKELKAQKFYFAPIEKVSGQTASIFIANRATHGANGKYTEIAIPNNLNAIRACFLAKKLAIKYNGVISSKVAEIVSNDEIIKLIDATDAAELSYTLARTHYNTAQRQYTRRCEMLGVSASAESATDKNAVEVIARLKKEMEGEAQAYKKAKENESAKNWDIITKYFAWTLPTNGNN